MTSAQGLELFALRRLVQASIVGDEQEREAELFSELEARRELQGAAGAQGWRLRKGGHFRLSADSGER